MRLLDAEALIYDNVAELVDFPDESLAPKYAILSHTWEQEEVLFQDIALGPQHEIQPSISYMRALRREAAVDQHNSRHFYFLSLDDTDTHTPHVKAGWNKVLNTCLQTLRDGRRYVWIDTCCIDKSSSAELSEAINSMYPWYEAAAICYAYLSDYDVTCGPPDTLNELSPYLDKNRPGVLGLEPCTDIQSHFKHSRWFTRGWTLQELIAPKNLHFFDRGWRFIASRLRIVRELESITGIHSAVLSRQILYLTRDDEFWLSKYSVAQRMHWASKRKTTRKEDEAYCLLGIFEINMPLIYGEGGRAFQRLQREIIRTSTDQTILAWELLPDSDEALNRSKSILAQSPANFWWCAANITTTFNDPRDIRLTSEGLETGLRLEEFRLRYGYRKIIGQLNCGVIAFQRHWNIGIRLQVRWGLSRPGRRFVTDVDPQYASSIEESERSTRRLILLPCFENDDNLSTDRILILHPRSLPPPYAPLPPSLEFSVVFLFLQERLGSEDGGWVPSAVYPPSQWHAATATMTLPRESPAYGAIAMTRRSQEFVIVFGGVAPTSNYIGHADVPRGSPCQCWILKWPSEPANYPGPHVAYLDVKLLRDRAGQLSSMDYFERSSSRRDSHKWIRLEDSQTARLKVIWGAGYQQFIHLLYETTQVQDPGWLKDSGPLADRDYFQLEELGKPKRLFSGDGRALLVIRP